MKTLIVLRHAKSSWKDMSLTDFDRPLNKRGRRDAPFMAQKFKERKIMPDLILSSPSNRTQLTLKEFTSVLGGGIEEKVVYDQRLYLANCLMLLKLIRQQENALDTLLFVGHNPGLTDLANYFSQEYIDNIPTTGIMQFDFEIGHWQEINPQSAQLVFFDFPKNYFPKSVDK